MLLPVTLAGLNVFAAAVVALQARPLGAELGGIAVLVIGAALAEAFPVRWSSKGWRPAGSRAAVFIVGAAVLRLGTGGP